MDDNGDKKDVTLVDKVDTGMPMVIYALYLVALINGITAVIGVIMAYGAQGSAPAWMQSHYRFMIRTFWIGLLFSVIGGLLTMVLIGFLVLAVVRLWYIAGCVKGLMWLGKGEAVPDPASWLLGDART